MVNSTTVFDSTWLVKPLLNSRTDLHHYKRLVRRALWTQMGGIEHVCPCLVDGTLFFSSLAVLAILGVRKHSSSASLEHPAAPSAFRSLQRHQACVSTSPSGPKDYRPDPVISEVDSTVSGLHLSVLIAARVNPAEPPLRRSSKEAFHPDGAIRSLKPSASPFLADPSSKLLLLFICLQESFHSEVNYPLKRS